MTSIELSLGKLQNSKHFYCTYSKRQTIVKRVHLILVLHRGRKRKLKRQADEEETRHVIRH